MSLALTNQALGHSRRVVSLTVDPAAPALFRAVRSAFTVLAVCFFAPIANGQQINVDAQDTEVLTRGAIHDAFAIPVGLDPVAGPIVPREPPTDIEELPPEVAVEDPNAEWIPGYWTWDEERNDFVWTSGVWRVAPPNHRWVAGYWTQVAMDNAAPGFQRISGFWAPNETRQVVYYPQPPASLEAGPNVPQPSPDYFWVPGNWVYTDGRYVWRGGYWAASQQNWVWIPAYYVRTPGGYIYNAGYWDYPFDNRGMIFAPVYFSNNVYTRPGFRYSPSVLIRATQLLVHLFVQPNYGRYYFGDYYGPTYANAGYYPWFAAPRGNMRWYDPIYVYQRHHHRGDPNWSRRWQEQHEFYVQHQEARPRRTFSEQRQFASAQGPNRDRNEFRNAILATSVSEVVNNVGNTNVVNNTSIDKTVIKNITNVNIRRVQNDERVKIEKRADDFKQFAKQRSQVERESRVAGGPQQPDGRGPRPQQGQVAAGPVGATLTLPEVKNPQRVNVGFGPRDGDSRAQSDNPDQPRGDRPNVGPRPDRTNQSGPDRPNQAGPDRPAFPDRPNVNRPDADNPQAGRPTPMPGGPGGPRRGDVTPDGRPNVGDVPNADGTPNVTPRVPRMPEIPNAPGTGELPRAPRGNQPGGPNVPGRADPSLPGATPMPTPKLPEQPGRPPRTEQPRNNPPQFDQPRPGQPRAPRGDDQPRVNSGRNGFSPGNPNPGNVNPGNPNGGPKPENPNLGNPNRGNRGERPNFGGVPGIGAPGVTREQPMPKPNDRPPQTERPQQRERPQQIERPRNDGPKNDRPKNAGPQAGPKPDRGPPAGKPDSDKPKGTKPEKEEKK